MAVLHINKNRIITLASFSIVLVFQVRHLSKKEKEKNPMKNLVTFHIYTMFSHLSALMWCLYLPSFFYSTFVLFVSPNLLSSLLCFPRIKKKRLKGNTKSSTALFGGQMQSSCSQSGHFILLPLLRPPFTLSVSSIHSHNTCNMVLLWPKLTSLHMTEWKPHDVCHNKMGINCVWTLCVCVCCVQDCCVCKPGVKEVHWEI